MPTANFTIYFYLGIPGGPWVVTPGTGLHYYEANDPGSYSVNWGDPTATLSTDVFGDIAWADIPDSWEVLTAEFNADVYGGWGDTFPNASLFFASNSVAELEQPTGVHKITYDGIVTDFATLKTEAPGFHLEVSSATTFTCGIVSSDDPSLGIIGGIFGTFSYVELLVDPSTGPTGGGTAVTITGSDFVDGATVTFDGVAATSVVFVDANTLTAVTPAHLAEAVTVVVTNPDTSSQTGINAFEYVTITLYPTVGTTFGDQTIEMSGQTIPVDSTLVVDTEPVVIDFTTTPRTFQTPAHTPGVVLVEVTTPEPDVKIYSTTFRYLAFPSVTPQGGDPDGGTLITLNRWFSEEGDGTEFVSSGVGITFGGVSATDITFVDIDHYTCKTPAHAAAIVDIVVSNINSLAVDMVYENGFGYSRSGPGSTIDAGPTQIAHGPAPGTATLTATASGEDLTFLWEQTGGPQIATIGSPTALITTVTFPAFIPGVYTFRITAFKLDFPGIQDSTTVTIHKLQQPNITITGGAP